MASSSANPPVLAVSAMMVSFIASTATWLVPPPRQMIILPDGVPMGRSTPKAAANGCRMRYTSRLPEPKPASWTARLSTLVTPYGTVIITRGRKKSMEPVNRLIRYWSIRSVTSYSAITPCCNGWTTSMDSGTRPTISFAARPHSTIFCSSMTMATTVGSSNKIWLPSAMTVFIVPRSMPSSRENTGILEFNLSFQYFSTSAQLTLILAWFPGFVPPGSIQAHGWTP